MKENKCTVFAVSNQKGGTSKSVTAENLGVGLVKAGKKVLLIDLDPQGSLTASLGIEQPDDLPVTISTLMEKVINDEVFDPFEGIIHNEEGMDLVPGNIDLSELDVSLVNIMSREVILKEYISMVSAAYDVIIIDCMPSLGMLTINAITAADMVIIPVQPAYLSVRGLQQLLVSIGKIRRRLNPDVKIAGILLTMVDSRTVYAREIMEILRDGYGDSIGVFDTFIPASVRAAEIAAEGVSIFKHDPKGKVAKAYENLTTEILEILDEGRKEEMTNA